MMAPDLMEWVPISEGLKPRVSLPRSCVADQSLKWTVVEEIVLRLPLMNEDGVDGRVLIYSWVGEELADYFYP